MMLALVVWPNWGWGKG